MCIECALSFISYVISQYFIIDFISFACTHFLLNFKENVRYALSFKEIAGKTIDWSFEKNRHSPKANANANERRITKEKKKKRWELRATTNNKKKKNGEMKNKSTNGVIKCSLLNLSDKEKKFKTEQPLLLQMRWVISAHYWLTHTAVVFTAIIFSVS